MYYKVTAFQTKELGKSERLCDIIVYKKKFNVYELLTNEEVSTKKGNTIFGNKKVDGKLLKELSNYKKSVYILKEDLGEYHIATEADIKDYVDESDKNLYVKFVEQKRQIDEEKKKYQGI